MNQFALFHAPHRRKCDEFNLVLQAVDIDSEVVEFEGRHYLLVEDRFAERAYSQLKRYVDENTPEEVISRPLIPFSRGLGGAYIYALILLLFGFLQMTAAFSINWHDIGLADSWKIAAGEKWRVVTALTLHADIAHLASNIGFGMLFGLLVSQHIGSAAAWFTILLAGSAGNLVNAWLYQTLHQSLGASTAVFAALGMLGVFALDTRRVYRSRSMRRWLPFVATLALLAMTGTAGERTDVLAHLSGFGCGCIAGMLWLGYGMPHTKQRGQQPKLVLFSFLLLFGAWALALSSH